MVANVLIFELYVNASDIFINIFYFFTYVEIKLYVNMKMMEWIYSKCFFLFIPVHS